MPKHKKGFSESSDDSNSDNSNISETDSEISDTENSTNESNNEYNDDIRNTIYENIDESYAYARLGELDVIMMKKNGYINATKLCHKNKKEFSNWY